MPASSQQRAPATTLVAATHAVSALPESPLHVEPSALGFPSATTTHCPDARTGGIGTGGGGGDGGGGGGDGDGGGGGGEGDGGGDGGGRYAHSVENALDTVLHMLDWTFTPVTSFASHEPLSQ